MHTASRFVYPSEWFFSFPLLNPKPQTKISSIPCVADERNCWVWIPICLLSGAVELPQRALCNCPGEEEMGLQRRWFPDTSGRPGSLRCNNTLLKRGHTDSSELYKSQVLPFFQHAILKRWLHVLDSNAELSVSWLCTLRSSRELQN